MVLRCSIKYKSMCIVCIKVNVIKFAFELVKLAKFLVRIIDNIF